MDVVRFFIGFSIMGGFWLTAFLVFQLALKNKK